MIGGRRPVKGRKLADRRVRVERPHSPYFRYTRPEPARRQGGREPAAHAARPRRRAARALPIGRPLASEEEIGERLSKKKALAIFSSDAISSSAYATEEILRVLILAGAGARSWSRRGRGRHRRAARRRFDLVPAGLLRLPVGRRRVRRGAREPGPALRPHRGGRAAHRLRHDRRGLDGLGRRPDRLGRPGARSRSASRSAWLSITLITIANLRGLRESGNIFAIPTYLFVGGALLIVGLGTAIDRSPGRRRRCRPGRTPSRCRHPARP